MVHDGQRTEDHPRRHGRTLAGALWFPALFFFGFLACYLLPFHSLAPHHVEVAVAPPAAARVLSRDFAARSPGSFDLVTVPDAAAVREMVIDRQVVAGYSATGTGGDLYVAQAGGAELEQIVSAAFTPVAARSGPGGHGALRTVDLVPAAHGDQTGTGLFYLSLPWALVPYILVMMLGRASLTRRGKLLTLAGAGAFISVVGYYIGLAIAVVPDRPLALVYAFLATQAVAWTTYGLVPYARRLLLGVGVLLVLAGARRERRWRSAAHGVATTPMLGGRVRRADGTPVADAGVTVLDAQGRQLVRARTDDDSRYAVTGLPEEALTVDFVLGSPPSPHRGQDDDRG